MSEDRLDPEVELAAFIKSQIEAALKAVYERARAEAIAETLAALQRTNRLDARDFLVEKFGELK